jgi:hypothetical protein
VERFLSNHGFWIIVVGLPILGWIITDIVQKIADNWRKVRVSEHLAALKQSMIDRGMTAEEIERVINAGQRPAKDVPRETINAGVQ